MNQTTENNTHYNTYAEECKATAIKELEEEFDRMTAILRKANNTK